MMAEIIYLCHPSRERPEQAARVYQLWQVRADKPERLLEILSLDDDDPALASYHRPELTLCHANRGMVSATNHCLAACKDDGLLVTLYDDFEPPEHWDTLLWEIHQHNAPCCIFVSCDSLQVFEFPTPTGTAHQIPMQTIQIGSVEVFRAWGYILYPDYFSMFSDNDYTLKALSQARVINALQFHFRHHHPLLTGRKEDWDVTYQRSNAQIHYQAGETIFRQRLATRFQD